LPLHFRFQDIKERIVGILCLKKGDSKTKDE
jgi:hypothetical protein